MPARAVVFSENGDPREPPPAGAPPPRQARRETAGRGGRRRQAEQALAVAEAGLQRVRLAEPRGVGGLDVPGPRGARDVGRIDGALAVVVVLAVVLCREVGMAVLAEPLAPAHAVMVEPDRFAGTAGGARQEVVGERGDGDPAARARYEVERHRARP